MDLHKSAHGKYVAKMCKLRGNLELGAKMVGNFAS